MWTATGLVIVGLLALSVDNGPGSAGDLETLLAEGRARLRDGDSAGALVVLGRARRLYPRESRVWEALGAARAGSLDLRGATAALHRALALDPKRFETHLALARLHGSTRDLDTARAFYDKAARLRPSDPVPLRELGALELAAEEPAAALRAFDRLLARSAQDGISLLGRARAVAALEGPTAELEALEHATDQAPELPEIWRALAELRLERHDLEGSLAAYRRLVELRPTDALAWVAIGAALQARGDCRGALGAFEHGTPDSVEPEARCLAWTGIATCRIALGDKEPALEALERALAVEPDAPEALVAAAPLYLERGQPERALEALEKAASRFADRADVHQLAGRASLEASEFRSAEIAFMRALELSPEDHEARRGLAVSRLGLGDYRTARSLLEAEAARAQLPYDAQVALGVALVASGRAAQGALTLSAATQSEPGRPEAWAFSASLALERGDAVGALRLLNRGRSAGAPEHAALLEVQARALSKRGEHDAARASARRARALARSERERAYLDRLLQTL